MSAFVTVSQSPLVKKQSWADGSAAAGLNGGRGQVGDRQIHNALHTIVSVNRHLAMGESPYHLVPLAFICGRCGDLLCRTVLDSTPSAAADPNAGFSVIVAPDGRQLDVDSFHGRALELKQKSGTGFFRLSCVQAGSDAEHRSPTLVTP